MGEVELMSPTVTDRVHYFMISDSLVASRIDEGKKVDGKEHLSETVISEADYSIGIYREMKKKDNMMGMIVPNKAMREKYFRLALVSFVAGILWMIVIGLTLVGWTIGAILAGFGFSLLLAIMEPIGPFLIPIFIIATGIAAVPIVTIIVYYPYFNRNIARKGIIRLKNLVQATNPDASFNELKIKPRMLDLTIRQKLPEEFVNKVEGYLTELGISEGMDKVSYTLVERP